MTDTASGPDGSGGLGTVNRDHLPLIGAGPGLGEAVARRFAVGGCRVTLVARSADRLRDLAGNLSDTGAQIVAGSAFDPVRITERYWDVVQSDGPWQAEFRFTGEPE